MAEILSKLESLFGSRVIVVALVLVLVYTVIQSLATLLYSLKERRSAQSRLNALKTQYEILKIIQEIEALKIKHNLPENPQEIQLASEAQRLAEELSQSDFLTETKTALEKELITLFKRYKWIGGLFYYATQLGLRLWGMGMLTYSIVAALFGDESTKAGANWDNIMIADFLIIAGFWLSSLLISATQKAGIKDRFRYWPYVIGFLIATFLVWWWSIT